MSSKLTKQTTVAFNAQNNDSHGDKEYEKSENYLHKTSYLCSTDRKFFDCTSV